MDTSRFILQPVIQFKDTGVHTTKFEIAPLNRGYAQSIGNTLRRILLSSIPGAAIVSVKFDGVNHELSTIKGVRDDVLSIMMKLKKIRIKINSGEQANLYLNIKKEGKIFAGDFEISGDAEIVNPELEITELNKGAELDIECLVETGFEYLPVEDRQNEEMPEGYFPLDALFSPVLSVSYFVEDARVGQITNLDKLILEIKTDGTITPIRALEKAIEMLSFSVENFMNAISKATPSETESKKSQIVEENLKSAQIKDQQKNVKSLTVDEIGLSPRTLNALKNNLVNTVDDIVKIGREKISTLKGIGGKALKEVFERLEELGIKI
ncbi:MAG: DNA-directed RNA polymerase subunit alpha [Patescibacteria group bacterium]